MFPNQNDTLPVPVYGQRQRDVLWGYILEFFPRLKAVGRDEVVSSKLMCQGLRFLLTSLLGRIAPRRLAELNLAMADAAGEARPPRQHNLPVYNRRQRALILERTLSLFPRLDVLEERDLVGSDYTAQTLRLAIEAVYKAEGAHMVKLGIPEHLAYERLTIFTAGMIEATRPVTLEAAPLAA
jgi:hypothetical protein